MITDSNMLKCEKCGTAAMTNLNGVWLCGECAIKHINIQKEKNRKLILEE
jgi:ribosomal protein L37AE/L43A